MKSQTARVVLIESGASLWLASLTASWKHALLSNCDGARTPAASICGLRSSKSIRTDRAGAVLRRLPERRLRSRRLANVHPDKFANNRRLQRRTSRASRGVGKTACKKQQSHCWWSRVPTETLGPIGCDRTNRKPDRRFLKQSYESRTRPLQLYHPHLFHLFGPMA